MWLTLLISAGITALAALSFYIFHMTATVAAILLMLAVLIVGAYSNRMEAVAASIVATLSLDYYFIPPIRQITVADPQGWVVLSIFLTASLLATSLSATLRKQRDELIARQKESDKLHALSRAMLLSNGGEDLRRLLVNKSIELFGFRETALFESATGEFYRSQMEGTIRVDDLRRSAVQGTLERLRGSGVDGITIVPVTLGNKTYGSFAFRGVAMQEATLQALANTIAVGLAQVQAQEAGSRAEAVRKSEELKSVMIDALAHELKTPLTAIEAAADMLRQPVAAVTPEQREDLLSIIQQEAKGLRRLMGEAIHLARIEAKRFRLEMEVLSIADLIDAAVHSLGDRVGSHSIQLEVEKPTPKIYGDRELMIQMVKQLLDNATKYSPARSVITVLGSEENGLVNISVRDQGQGLTELEQRRVFDKFYRAKRERTAVQGTGMGLSIAREIAEAHGGSVSVESQQGQGSRFTITMQSAGVRRQAEPQSA